MKFTGKWLYEERAEKFKNACLLADKILNVFKLDPDIISIIGNDARPGIITQQFEDAMGYMPYCEQNDKFGGPLLHHNQSTGTLRFMQVVDSLSIYDFKNVVEIGGGYGGQCLVMKNYRDVYYTIIELPETLTLTKAYLKANHVNCNFISTDEVPEKMNCDLLISDYCLGEFDKQGIDFYLDNIDFQVGYFTVENPNYIFEKLNEKYHLFIKPEEPATSEHRNQVIIAQKIKPEIPQWLIITCKATKFIVPLQKYLFKKFIPFECEFVYVNLDAMPVDRWTKNILERLKYVKINPYFVFGLDDYTPLDMLFEVGFFVAKNYLANVKGNRFELAKYASIKSKKGRLDDIGAGGILKFSEELDYSVSCQFSWWNRDKFFELLTANTMSPWEFEVYLRIDEVYCYKPENACFRYIEESSLSKTFEANKINLTGMTPELIEEIVQKGLVDRDRVLIMS